MIVLPGLRGPSSAPGQPEVHEFARIPVVNNGRVKPMDTIARTHLRIMSNRETFKDKSGASRSAIEWLLDVEADERESSSHPVFRIDHPQLLNALELGSPLTRSMAYLRPRKAEGAHRPPTSRRRIGNSSVLCVWRRGGLGASARDS